MNFAAGTQTDTDFIPSSYFCKWEIETPNTIVRSVNGAAAVETEVDWKLSVYRYMSGIYTEDIDLVLHSGL